jgi:hypothetical protein
MRSKEACASSLSLFQARVYHVGEFRWAIHGHTQAIIEFSIVCILHELSSEPSFVKATNRKSRQDAHPRQNGVQVLRSSSRKGYLWPALLDGMINIIVDSGRDRAFGRQWM